MLADNNGLMPSDYTYDPQSTECQAFADIRRVYLVYHIIIDLVLLV